MLKSVSDCIIIFSLLIIIKNGEKKNPSSFGISSRKNWQA